MATTKSKKSKKKNNRAKPSDLGAGAARRAAETLQKSKSRIDRLLERAQGIKKKKSKKSKKGKKRSKK